jgi:DNA-binding transcriptional LysR family regulator
MAPSSVSRRIAELEDRLGVRLLRRTTRKLSLTEAGATYYERAQGIVRAVEEANLAVTEQRAAPSGILRMTVPASVARRHLAPAVAAFQMRYPAVRIVMSVTDRLVDLVDEGWDVAIRVGRLEDSSLIARKIGAGRRLVCASPAYLKRAGRPRRPIELSDHACLTFRSHPGSNLWRFRKGDSVSEVRATGPFFADSGGALVAAACAGLGLVLLPVWLLGEELGRGRLEPVLGDYAPDPATTPLHAVYAPGPYVAPKVRAMIDFLIGRFGAETEWDGHADMGRRA